MFAMDCESCGGRFTAKRGSAKYCSDRCRKRAQRAPEPAPLRREGAALVALPAPAATAEGGFVETTRRQLEAAQRLDTYQGVAAMFAAQLLDSGVQDTMSSMAAMLREYKATMKEALDGAEKVADPLDEILARRASRSA